MISKLGITFTLIFLLLPFGVSANSIFSNEQLLERQKELYSSGDWDSFFGGAMYLRGQKPSSAIQDAAIALELMALARHCQWSVIEDIQKNHASYLKGSLSQKALSFVHLKKDYKVFINDARSPKEGLNDRIEKSKTEWFIEPQNILTITNPEKLKMSVRSLCPF